MHAHSPVLSSYLPVFPEITLGNGGVISSNSGNGQWTYRDRLFPQCKISDFQLHLLTGQEPFPIALPSNTPTGWGTPNSPGWKKMCMLLYPEHLGHFETSESTKGVDEWNWPTQTKYGLSKILNNECTGQWTCSYKPQLCTTLLYLLKTCSIFWTGQEGVRSGVHLGPVGEETSSWYVAPNSPEKSIHFHFIPLSHVFDNIHAFKKIN